MKRKQLLSDISVLIADADIEAATYLERELISRGYCCTRVTSGRNALAAARKKRFDVAVIDMDLDDLKGYQLIPLLKDMSDRTKMVFSTSQHSVGIERRARQAGIVFYAIKANSMLELLSAVSSAVKAKRSEDAAESIA